MTGALLAAVLASAVVALAGDITGGALTLAILAPTGLAVVALAHLAVRRGRRPPSLRRHLALTGAIAVGGRSSSWPCSRC